MSQSLRNSADKLAKLMADRVGLQTMLEGLEIVVQTEPNLLVAALQTMDADTTKNMIVLAMTMVIIAKTEESV